MLNKVMVAFAAVVIGSQSAAAQSPQVVDIELSLLVDVSGSISSAEFDLQKTGYVNVFNKQTFWDAYAAGNRSLAVQYTEWSGATQQSSTNWYQITNYATAQTFAQAISNKGRSFAGQTAPGNAINYGIGQLNNNAYLGTTRLIDISSDGCQNDGSSTSAARNAAVAANITINVVTIGTENSDCGGLSLANWYDANAKTANGFSRSASNFSTFGAAIEDKIGTEIGVVPEPSSMALLSFGMLGLLAAHRRRNTVA